MCVVDVRDSAELHVRAMLALGSCEATLSRRVSICWMHEITALLRERLGARGDQVPTKRVPDMAARFGALFNDQLAPVAQILGPRVIYSSASVGWHKRAEEDTPAKCAEGLR